MTATANDELLALIATAGAGAQPEAQDAADTLPAMMLRQGSRWFALAAHAVSRVVLAGPITRVPELPAHVVGLTLIQGNLVAVVDLAALVGVAAEPSQVARMVVLDHGGVQVALTADEVRGVIDIPEAFIGPGSSLRLVRGEVDWGDFVVAVLDDARLLAAAVSEAGP